jgi:Heterokaryon incompatibility protein (HET)
MAQIYSCASRTLIWLGEETPDVSQSFETIKLARGLFPPITGQDIIDTHFDRQDFEALQWRKDEAGEMNLWRVDWQSVVNLFVRPWFRRKWIIQEVVKSRDGLMFCGVQQLPWVILRDLVLWLTVHNLTTFSYLILGEPLANIGMNNILAISWPSTIFTLPQLLSVSMSFFCSDDRDNIIALLNLVRNVSQEDITHLADYSLSPIELFLRYAQWLLSKHQSIEFLDSGFDPIPRQTIVIPSWLPYFGPWHDSIQRKLPPSDFNFMFDAAKRLHPQADFQNDGRKLKIWGKELDTIDKLSSIYTEGHVKQVDTTANARIVMARVSAWFRECESIAAQGRTSMKPEKLEEFWRTLCLDRETEQTRASSGFEEIFREYLRVVNSSWEEMTKEDGFQERSALFSRVKSVTGALYGRRFCSSGGGHFGVVDADAQVGDRLCVFYGGRMPYIIRPAGLAEYTFVGVGYLHGFMDGEAVDREDLHEEEFSLV